MTTAITPKVPIKKTGVKKSANSRLKAGGKVATQGPLSPLYAQPAIKTAVNNVAAETTSLKSKLDAYNAASSAFTKCRTALGLVMGSWDGAYDLLVATGATVFVTADDAASVALEVGGHTKNPLAMPTAITITQNLKKNLVRIHVTRAPGMTSVSLQISTNPTQPALWKELDGDGAVHENPESHARHPLGPRRVPHRQGQERLHGSRVLPRQVAASRSAWVA